MWNQSCSAVVVFFFFFLIFVCHLLFLFFVLFSLKAFENRLEYFQNIAAKSHQIFLIFKSINHTYSTVIFNLLFKLLRIFCKSLSWIGAWPPAAAPPVTLGVGVAVVGAAPDSFLSSPVVVVLPLLLPLVGWAVAARGWPAGGPDVGRGPGEDWTRDGLCG